MTATDSTTPLLEVRGLTLRFGGVTALSNVSFDVHPGELFAIIGPNGAGKTSIFNCLSAVYRPQERSEEHTSELQSLMRISYAVFCLKNKKNTNNDDKVHS